MTRLAGINMI